MKLGHAWVPIRPYEPFFLLKGVIETTLTFSQQLLTFNLYFILSYCFCFFLSCVVSSVEWFWNVPPPSICIFISEALGFYYQNVLM